MRKLFVALAFGALLLPGKAFSLGLGEIEVNSALNQEFDAEIELLSTAPEDLETLIVKLAPRDEFTRAGIDRPYFLNDLRFVPRMKNGRPVIAVTSSKPVREPYLDFLIEVDWPKGHLMREYTVLLDPPVFLGPETARSSSRPGAESRPASTPTQTVPDTNGARPAASARPAPVAVPVPVPAPEPEPAETMRPAEMRESAAVAPAPVAEAEPEPEHQYQAPEPAAAVAAPVTRQGSQYRAPPGGYRIQQGDTAWSLADAMRPDQDISIQQMMLALLRSNPEAFIEENINGLKRGYILRIPDRSYIAGIDREQALAEVKQHHSLWREYQAKLSGKPLPAPDVEAGPGIETEADTGAERATSLDDLGEPDGQLEIVSAGSGADVAGSGKDPSEMTEDELRAQLALAEEQLESERLQKEGMEGEVADLEGKVEKMKRLLAIEDETLAEMQAAGAPADEPMEPVEDEAEIVAESEMDDMLEEMPADMLDETGETLEQAADEAAQEIEDIAEDTETAVDDMAAEVAEIEPMPEEVQPAEDLFRPQPPENPIMRLLDNPIVLSGAGALVLLLMLLTYILVKRKRAANEEQAAAQAVFDSDLEGVADLVDDTAVSAEVSDEEVEQEMAEAAAAADDEGLEDLDTESTMVLPAADDTVVTEAQTAAASEDEEPRDDVIAEADVYLAYGIYQQAEELLQNAINENTERDDYRAKLCETHFAAKNVDSFTRVATELHQRLGGKDTPMWQKVVAMGKELCPDNDLFKGGSVPDLPVDELVPSPEPMDFDLGTEAGGDDELQLPEADASDLEFDLGDIETGTETVSETDTETQDADLDLELDTDALDIGEAGEEPSVAPVEEESDELEFDLSAEAADLDLDTGEETDEAESSLDLETDAGELELDTESTMVISEEESSAEGGEDEEIDFSDLSDIDEVATKLDLARAYLDMGDNEGTRSILEEVLADGNEEQKKDAEELLKQVEG